MKQKIFLILTLLSAATFTAQAKIDTQALKACGTIKNDQNRLLCYDKAINGKALNEKSSNTELTATADDFGLEHKNLDEERVGEIKAVVISIKKAPYGKLIINLNNDQQWRQHDSERMLLKKGDKIVIRRGALNSFLLKKDGTNRSIRVKRTK
jgi:hypothetical protein